MTNYHILDLSTDVLLLADNFGKLCKTFLDIYILDAAHYYSSPGLAWNTLLEFTGMELDFPTDVVMHFFVGRHAFFCMEACMVASTCFPRDWEGSAIAGLCPEYFLGHSEIFHPGVQQVVVLQRKSANSQILMCLVELQRALLFLAQPPPVTVSAHVENKLATSLMI